MDVIKSIFGKTAETVETAVPAVVKKDDGFSRDVSTCPGYTVRSTKETEHGMTAELELAGNEVNAFGKDIRELVLEVEYQTEHRLHVHIRDAANKQYQIKDDILPRPGNHQPHSRELEFHFQKDPFAFRVTRAGSGEVLFDTLDKNIPKHKDLIKRGGKPLPHSDSQHHPLVFSDQYLQIASALPSDANIYGLGEIIDSAGVRRNNEGSLSNMWNRDAGTPADENLYGAHPFYLETRFDAKGGPSKSHGVFLCNSHGMDVLLRKGLIEYRALGGTLDFYFLSGPSPKAVIRQYSDIVGRPAQMPYWAFGLHLCRWMHEFSTVDRVQKVVEKMKKEDIPVETIWSDLDYMDKKRNFTAGEGYPEAKYRAFVDWLHENHQHYVPLVDAAIGMPEGKNDSYDVYTDGHDLDVFIKHPNGEEFIGEVWPGPTVFPDWSSPNVTKWWQKCFDDYRKIAKYDGIWLDMNEPSNFKTTQDKSLAKGVEYEANLINEPPYDIHNDEGKLGWRTVWPDCKLADGSLHYNVHNMYGYEENLVTHKVLLEQMPNQRPFMLSRSTFAGLGRVSAHWLGDNYSTWESMRHSLQGVLTFQMFNIPMVGPDSCGFSGDVTEELANRWMQLGAFYPFYRNHNADSAAPQEPYLWKSVAEATRKALKIRYQLLPYWESLFAEAKLNGTPPVRPLFFEFDDARLLPVEEQFLIGSSLLITPVVHEGKTAVTGYFPGENGTTWRDWTSGEVVKPDNKGQAELLTPLGHINVHIRSGSVILIHDKPGYTLKETRESGYGLIIHLDAEGKAAGEAVLDDGMSIEGSTTYVSFTVSAGQLKVYGDGTYKPEKGIKRLAIYGLEQQVRVDGAGKAGYRENSKVFDVEGLDLALSGESSISWE